METNETFRNLEEVVTDYYKVFKRQGKKLTDEQKERFRKTYNILLGCNYRLDLFSISDEMMNS